jgi:hypothetical protein
MRRCNTFIAETQRLAALSRAERRAAPVATSKPVAAGGPPGPSAGLPASNEGATGPLMPGVANSLITHA